MYAALIARAVLVLEAQADIIGEGHDLLDAKNDSNSGIKCNLCIPCPASTDDDVLKDCQRNRMVRGSAVMFKKGNKRTRLGLSADVCYWTQTY